MYLLPLYPVCLVTLYVSILSILHYSFFLCCVFSLSLLISFSLLLLDLFLQFSGGEPWSQPPWGLHRRRSFLCRCAAITRQPRVQPVSYFYAHLYGALSGGTSFPLHSVSGICIYIYVSKYVFMHASMFVCVCIFVCLNICMYICMRACIIWRR